jgi:hypothetical protein
MSRSLFSSVRPVKLSRRAILRGATGAAIGLPLLEAMTDDRGWIYGSAQAATPPVPRLLLVFTPNGLGNNGDEIGILQAQLATGGPLAPLTGDLTVVSGLYKKEADVNQPYTGDAHDVGHSTFASGMVVDAAGSGGPSIDQVAAQQYGGDTRFRSLPIAISVRNNPWLRAVSWSAKNTPVPPDTDPVNFFQRVFGGMTTSPTPTPTSTTPSYKQSIMDYLRGDLVRLQARVGSADRLRIDQHLAALRDLEQEVLGSTMQPTGTTCTVPAQPSSGTDPLSNDRLQLLMRILVMAMQCDLTRYASVQICNRQDARQFPWIGVVGGGASGDMSFEEGHHGISHDLSATGYDRLRRIAGDHALQLAFMLNLMKGAAEGSGTLLDNSVVMYGSEFSSSWDHGKQNMTVILAGKAGGKLASGRDLKSNGAPYANMLCSVLNYAGVSAAKFGAFGTGTIAGL